MLPQGKWFINGKDLYSTFGIIIESGTDGFLKWPDAKEGISRNYRDANGIDIDLSKIFFNFKEITLRCIILADSEDAFWSLRNGFMAEWAKGGYTRIQVTEFGNRSYYCYYKNMSDFTRFTPIRIEESGDIKVACKFTLNIVEGEPNLDNLATFIVDEQGRHLIT
ncbi:MAG: hypothetical protein J7527_16155 [Chitinophagaceae bacterium]|nr:hypothetical protein [Chitinophagaceae bacterium]